MFHNDYLMRMILQFVAALQRALNQRQETPEKRAEELEELVGDAIGIDANLLFSMAPETIVSMLQLGDFDERISGYVLRSMYLEADLLESAGKRERADLRRSQADAIVDAYDLNLSYRDATPEAIEAFLAEAEASEEQSDAYLD
jgi:hypothetical protein